MKLTVHRGTKEIGGSCIELATSVTRIVLDIGMPLVDAAREPFDQASIRGKSMEQLLTEGILPNVPGLFDDRPTPDAILLSHSHVDHVGLLNYSRSEIPIFASKGCSKAMLAGALFSRQVQLPTERYREMKAGHPFTIGDFRIKPYAADHSAFDSLALLIEADGKSLLYSGDLRMHGRKPGMGKKLVTEVSAKQIDLLLIEGTHFGGGTEIGISEYDLEEEIVTHLKDAQGIVLACFSPADVDRLVTYYRVAQRTGRTFVVDVYAAFVLHLVSGQAAIPRPVKAAGIRVYYNRSFQESYERRHRQRIHDLFVEDQITLEEILSEPQRHLMVFRPSMAKLDFQDRLPLGCRCLYSYWKGYLKNPDWIEHQQLVKQAEGTFIPAHASGHVYVRDLIDFVKAINARTVVPIHTFEPQEFRKHFDNVQLLNDGQTFELR